MRLTSKLLKFLHRVFDKDPDQFLALSLQYSSDMTWQVRNGFLKTTVTTGPGVSLSIDLSQFTVVSLVNFLASQSGYSVTYIDDTALAELSALVLLDSDGDIANNNGCFIFGYTSLTWAYLEAQASELEMAQAQVGNMLLQMDTTTANNEWLDELGSYYDVLRNPGEQDSQYGPRIIATVLRPCGNNVAMEAAISTYTGQQATVTDVVEYSIAAPLYNGASEYNGSIFHNSLAGPKYGLFDVMYAYDLLAGGDITAFQATVVTLINQIRDAGTHLRAIALSGSILSDALTPPTDGSSVQQLVVNAPFSDALTAPTDSNGVTSVNLSSFADTLTTPTDIENLSITYNYQYNGQRSYNGVIEHLGGSTVAETL